MPLSSASIRAALVILLLLAFLSCASAPPDPGPPLPGTAEGTIRISGNHPYERQVVLAGEGGRYWLLRTAELEGELLSLEGQAVRVHGMQSRTGSSELSVEWYELLAPPGRFSAVGTLGADRDVLVLRCGRGRREPLPVEVIIEGPLRESIMHYIGCRVWVSGERVISGGGPEAGRAGASGEAKDTSTVTPSRIQIIVSEYGVLGPAIPDLDVPHSTLPDSSRI